MELVMTTSNPGLPLLLFLWWAATTLKLEGVVVLLLLGPAWLMASSLLPLQPGSMQPSCSHSSLAHWGALMHLWSRGWSGCVAQITCSSPASPL